MEKQTLWNLGKDYSEVFAKHGGNLFRTGTTQSQIAINKTAKELDLTKSHILQALEVYQWG